MTFPLVCYCMAVPRPVVLLLKALDRLRSFVLAILPPAQPLEAASEEARPTPSSIKARLPAVEYGSTAAGRSCCGGGGAAVCVFCLEELEPRDEVREIGNCRHAFHRECIDEWVEKGRVSCPVCRSDVLPSRWRTIRQRPVFRCVERLLLRERHGGLDHDN